MTNEEAIKYLIVPILTSTKPNAEYLKQKEAYDLAIKALKEDRYGEGYAEGFLSGSSGADWRNDI